MPFFILIFIFPSSSSAFLSFIGDKTKEAIEVAAYADAVSEMLEEIDPDSTLSLGAKDLQRRSEKLRTEARRINQINSQTKRILNGPDWSSRRLDSNIRSTTNYIKRLKRYSAQVTALGVGGTTALNTAETNLALNEIQKNQQAILLQNEDSKIRELEKEQEHLKKWNEFSKSQRELRKQQGFYGKP